MSILLDVHFSPFLDFEFLRRCWSPSDPLFRLPEDLLYSAGMSLQALLSKQEAAEAAKAASFCPSTSASSTISSFSPPEALSSSSLLVDGYDVLLAELKDRVDLRRLSNSKNLPQHKGLVLPAQRIGTALVDNNASALVARVSDSIAAGSSGCVRLSPHMQPLFDIIIDQRLCEETANGGFVPARRLVRYYIDCKWSASADQEDGNLVPWIKERVKPFLGGCLFTAAGNDLLSSFHFHSSDLVFLVELAVNCTPFFFMLQD